MSKVVVAVGALVAGRPGAGSASLGCHTGVHQVGVDEPGEVGMATLSHEVRTAGVGEGQGSQEAAFANHGETLCRWALVGLVVGSRSSEAVGDQDGKHH